MVVFQPTPTTEPICRKRCGKVSWMIPNQESILKHPLRRKPTTLPVLGHCSFTNQSLLGGEGRNRTEDASPFRLQLTQVQALEYIDFTGVQALFAIVRSPPRHCSPIALPALAR